MNSFHVPERFNAADYFVDENIRKGRGQKIAIYSAEKNYTYDEVYQNVNRCGNLLKTLGVEMENRVLLLLQDSPEFIISFFGAIKIGAIPIPTNTMLKAPDFEYVLNDSRAKVLIIDQNFLPEIEKIKGNLKYLKTLLVVGKEGGNDPLFSVLLKENSPELEPAETKKDDAAFWLYSARKPDELMGAIHLQKNMAYCTEYYARTILGMDEKDIVLSSYFFFAYGLGNGVYFPFGVGGATVLFPERPLPEKIYELIQKFRPTIFMSVPTLFRSLLDYKESQEREGKSVGRLNSLRACVASAEVLSLELYQRWKQTYGVEILDGTGSTEACHIFLSSRIGNVLPGSAGQLVPGYEGKLVDEDGNEVGTGKIGNLLLKGETIASAYWNKHDETKRNMLGEWFVTGDRYIRDKEGFFHYQGRSDDMMRVGGKWVSPMEIEKTLLAHPAVSEAAVVDYKDEDDLVKPYGFIVLKKGEKATGELEEDLKSFVKERIAPYKYPRWIEFADDLPKTASGTIQRYLLKQRLLKKQ